ncbi:DNA methyltransferase [Clostridium perfringens]
MRPSIWLGTTNCRWDNPIELEDYAIIRGKKIYYNEFLTIEETKNTFRKKKLSKKVLKNIWNKICKKGLWSHYYRIIKDNGIIIMFAQAPFDKVLGYSNLKNLRYEWIWEKTQATGYLNANRMPMKAHENILIFYKKLPSYNPQKTFGHKPANFSNKKAEIHNKSSLYGKVTRDCITGGQTDRYPRSVIKFSSDKQKEHYHETQKPLLLIDYLIKSYSTTEGLTILDNCSGSNSTAIAGLLNNMNVIAIEKDLEIFNSGLDRLLKYINERNIKIDNFVVSY